MKNADYWRERAKLTSDAAHADANEYIRQLEEVYRDAVMSVKADLDRWFGRFAGTNGITLAEARKQLTAGEMEEFRWTVDQYIQAAEEHGLDPAWQKKLENASARFHVSRLEAIQTQMQQQAERVFGNQTDGLDELLRKVADNGYNHAAFNVMQGLGIGWDFTKLDQARLDAMLKKPWTSDGKTFTDRCWEGKANLVEGIQRELVQSLMRGDSLAKTRDAIAKRFDVSKYQAGRLAHTEATYFNAVSTQACYEDLGVEKTEILETLDKHTCEICAAMDGKVIDKKDYQPGVTVPPFHPNCRGTTCPWFDDMEDVGERIARDQDGEVYHVPPDMTYQEWEKTFQEGGIKRSLTLFSMNATMKAKLQEYPVTDKSIESVPLVQPEGWSKNQAEALQKAHRDLLRLVKDQPVGTEAYGLYNAEMDFIESKIGETKGKVRIPPPGYPCIAIHNHPDAAIFSPSDITNFVMNQDYIVLTAIGNDGTVFMVQKTDDFSAADFIHHYNTFMPEDPHELENAEQLADKMRLILKEANKYGIFYLERRA